MTDNEDNPSTEEILKRGKELAEEYSGKYWKIHDDDTHIMFKWDGETYVAELDDNC